MRRPKTLAALSEEERDRAHLLLATRVAHMMGRKFEEGDWSFVYCAAKGIPDTGWSNLNIDVMHNGLGVEHKMLRVRAEKRLQDVCGTTLMHPAATRSIRIPAENDPNAAMRDVLGQYAELIQARREKVREDAPGAEPDMRTGWLLWQNNLRDFIYFEEEMLSPDPDDYVAEWRVSGGGTRKESRNLWVFEKDTGRKRYSITTAAGAKIQPYFDVPPPTDPNLYSFTVQGELLGGDVVRMWVTASTARELAALLGKEPDAATVSDIILQVASELEGEDEVGDADREPAVALMVTREAYDVLTASFNGVSDEHMAQLLVARLREKAPEGE